MLVAHLGTFDVANYGDLLFPLILEMRCADLPIEIVHVSPAGGRPIWNDCLSTHSISTIFDSTPPISCVIVGGGHIISTEPTLIDTYNDKQLLSLLAYPSLWLGATQLAINSGAALCWNAPGVPAEIAKEFKTQIQWATESVDYLSVRDQTSRSRLLNSGVTSPIHVTPDTALDIANLWSENQLITAYKCAFSKRKRSLPKRTIAFHLTPRFASESAEELAFRMDCICNLFSATAILVPLGPCHNDNNWQKEVSRYMQTEPLLIEEPDSLIELASCIAKSVTYFGSSLHGLITALSFGNPAITIMPESSCTRTKISDFLASHDLTKWLCNNWLQAEQLSSAVLNQPENMWKNALQSSTANLEKHWSDLRRVIIRAFGNSQSIVIDKKQQNISTASNNCISREYNQAIIRSQARRVPELLRRINDIKVSNRRSLSQAEEERKALKTDLEYSKSECKQLQSKLKNMSHVIVENRKLTAWLQNLQSGFQDLLETNRWKVGNFLGTQWSRINGKSRLPTIVDHLHHIFDRFEKWQVDWKDSLTGKKHLNDQASTKSSTHANIIICVHNALEHVQACLESIVRHTDPGHQLIIIDDGSSEDCREYLSFFVASHPHCQLIINSQASGYTRAANQGLAISTGEYAVLLNSDTIVTHGWLNKLLECGSSIENIGIVGPLSNAASWQSIPSRFSKDGHWKVNEIPEKWSIDEVATAVTTLSKKSFPQVPLLNGFCLAIHSSVIEKIGLLDEKLFPYGYGEENDYCLRAIAAGFRLAIADHAYVFHAKTKSYSLANRQILSEQGQRALIKKYGKSTIAKHTSAMRDNTTLAQMRRLLSSRIQKPPPNRCKSEENVKIKLLFLLPVRGGGGGAHSVVQEAIGLRRLGLEVKIAARLTHQGSYSENYPEAGDEGIFCYYSTEDELISLSNHYDVAIATIHSSMWSLQSIVRAHPAILPAYYVQDYEPFFYPKNSASWIKACDSYSLIPEALLFAKTNWISKTVSEKHNISVQRVVPSLDHNLFYPRLGSKVRPNALIITAMIRPATPRRASHRTMMLLRQIKNEFGREIDIHLFGCHDREITSNSLPEDFEYNNHGVLLRREVAPVLRDADLFVDFSDYQAFGRTGLEAMASGCAVILPQKGGSIEYAQSRKNCLLVDTSNDDECLVAIRELVRNHKFRKNLQEQGVITASEYSIHRASVSLWKIFSQAIEARKPQNHGYSIKLSNS